jgi:phosphatidylglycerophosphate synthase
MDGHHHVSVREVPNILSISRILMAPLMLVSAALGWGDGFTMFYAMGLLTDAVDGFLARRLHAESKRGATLDSRGDMAVALSLPIGAFLLWPAMMRSLIPYIVVALVAYLAPIIAGEIRYRRLPSFHTWGAKLCAINAGLSILVLFVTQNSLWFKICIPLLVLESIEELIMIAILPRWHPDVPSLWHALRLRHCDADAGKTLPDSPLV